MRYRVEIRRLGFLAYSWEVYSTSATSRLPIRHGCATTKRSALRKGEGYVRSVDPIIVKEFP